MALYTMLLVIFMELKATNLLNNSEGNEQQLQGQQLIKSSHKSASSPDKCKTFYLNSRYIN